MNFKISFLSLLFTFLLFSHSENLHSQNKNWTFFRGSNRDGIATSENIPLVWNDSTIRWKTEIHDRGWSSPVIYDDQIWITTAKPDGKGLYALCIDYNTGKIIYDILLFSPTEVEGKHSFNTYATPTPCIEKGFVYVNFGSFGTACLKTTDGSVVWKRNDLKCKHVQGPGASPVLYKNLLILHFEGTDTRFIVALNKKDGSQVWRSDRPAAPYEPLTVIGRKSYITPIIINVKGQDMLISNGSAVCEAFDPNTGKEIWSLIRGAESTIAMPFTEKGVVYWYTGFMIAPDGTNFTEILAVNPDGKGDISGTNILWRKKAEQLQLLTPIIKDGLIYTVDSKNNMMCIDAGNGSEVWSTHLRSGYNSSPIYTNGLLWFFSVKGEVQVIKAGRKYEVVANSQMDSPIWATPAFLRNSVILRTEKALYRIGN
jgi:outer membrane protein assembly factor BamB